MIYETYSVGGVLYHHGIQGMHWGVQNGPPYPLSKSISTGSRLKESAHGGSKENEVKILKDAIAHKNSDAAKKSCKAISSKNSKQIAKKMADEMLSDLKRWQEQGDDDSLNSDPNLKGKNEAEIKKILSSKVEKAIKNANENSFYIFSNKASGGEPSFTFVIRGIDEYGGGQPLDVEYYPESKKVKFYWS